MREDRRAADLLREGQAYEAAGDVSAAAECYAAAAERAAQDDEPRALSEALRRRGVLHHLQAEAERARILCCRAYDVAVVASLPDLASEALNVLGGFELEQGRLAEARRQFHAALELAASAPALTGKIEQNLGVVANVRGDWEAARLHYLRAPRGVRANEGFPRLRYRLPQPGPPSLRAEGMGGAGAGTTCLADSRASPATSICGA